MRLYLLLILFLLCSINYGKAQCDTSRWKAQWFNDNFTDTLSPALNAADFIKGGLLKVPFSFSSQQNCIGTNCPKTKIFFKDTLCLPDDFSFEVRLRNAPSEQGFDAYDVGIELLGNSGMNTGCILMGNSWAQRFTSVYAGTASVLNKPELVMNLSNWTTIKLKYAGNVLHCLKDNQEFYQLPYTGHLCNLLGFSFFFKGSGAIDWIRIKDGSGQMMYNEEFNDCSTLSLFPDNCTVSSATFNPGYLPPNCKDNGLKLFANSTQSLAYLWTGPNGFSSREANPVIENVAASAAGIYALEGRLNSCTPSLTKTIDVAFKVPRSFTIDTTICYGKSFEGHSSSGIYTDTFPSTGGCDSIRVTKLTVLPPVQADLGTETFICTGDSLVLSPGNFTSYQWQDGSARSHFTVRQPGIYSVQVANSCGTAKGSIMVAEGGCHFYFPTAFTPNGDGRNEVFKISNFENAYPFKSYHLLIYNRWGQKIFDTTNYAEGWNGTVNGNLQPTGVYIWYCEWTKKAGDQKTIRNGTITLIR